MQKNKKIIPKALKACANRAVGIFLCLQFLKAHGRAVHDQHAPLQGWARVDQILYCLNGLETPGGTSDSAQHRDFLPDRGLGKETGQAGGFRRVEEGDPPFHSPYCAMNHGDPLSDGTLV